MRRALAAGDVQEILRSAAAVDVVGAGKGAGPMVMGLLDDTPVPLRRVVAISAVPPSGLPPDVRWHITMHPVPDERSVTAAREVLALATAAQPRDALVLLLSGGASSMMALPASGLTLEDKQQTSRRLLTLGAEIHELNAVRKHLSGIKGGWLAAAHRGATLTFALSDVVGDDLSAIGSGPTVADTTTFAETLDVLHRYGGLDVYPSKVVERLTLGAAGELPETPKPGDPRLSRAVARVIGGGRTAVDGARSAAQALGYRVHVIEEPLTGEARVAAGKLIGAAGRLVDAADPAPTCILSAGETTVRTAGTGKGGRNQECTLAMVREIDRLGDCVVAASIGTDGIDGPTDAAGAILDSATLARAEAADVGPPERYLEEHNSYLFFDALADLIRTGPTGTNVGDLQVILVGR